MKAAWFCFGVALMFPVTGWGQYAPVTVSSVSINDYRPVDAREAAKYLDMIKINCLPEIGVLQVNAYDFKVGAQNQEAFYLNQERRENSLENKRIYHFNEDDIKRVGRVCVINGHKVRVRLVSSRCNKNPHNPYQYNKDETYPQDCLGAAISVKVDDALWVNNLELQNSLDFKKVNSLEIGQSAASESGDDEKPLLLRINYVSGRENVPLNVKHPNAQIKSDVLYSLTYPEKLFADGLVINDDNFWGKK